MSVRASAWAWDRQRDLPATAGKILLALADRADDHGVCWPGVAGLARKCAVSHRTVQRGIAHAEAAGLLNRRRRYDPRGLETSSLYVLALAADIPSPQGDTGDTHGSDAGSTPGASTVSPESSGESSEKPSSIGDDKACCTPNEGAGAREPLDWDLVERLANALASGRVHCTSSYIVAALRRAGLSTDKAMIDAYESAMRAHPVATGRGKPTAKKSPRTYSPELLAAAKAAGVDPAGRHPGAVAAEVQSIVGPPNSVGIRQIRRETLRRGKMTDLEARAERVREVAHALVESNGEDAAGASTGERIAGALLAGRPAWAGYTAPDGDIDVLGLVERLGPDWCDLVRRMRDLR